MLLLVDGSTNDGGDETTDAKLSDGLLDGCDVDGNEDGCDDGNEDGSEVG